MTPEPHEILEHLELRLEYLRRMGLRFVPAPPRLAPAAAAPLPAGSPLPVGAPPPSARRPVAPPPVAAAAARPTSAPSTPPAPLPPELLPTDSDEPPPPPKDRAGELQKVADYVAGCRRCVLHLERTNTVPGAGDPHAELMFVGEGPGYNEDQQGLPFVGRSGALLTKMIEAMGFTREQVFIGNVVKCRPPTNRDPAPDEIAACEPFLKRQLEIIAPKVIVGLGRHAVQTLLQTKTPISRLRGQWHQYHHIAFMPTFHPAYLLRNPAEKRSCWEDLQAVMVKLEELRN